MDRVYCIELEAVVSDIIDGEAVMLHRFSGDYFSTDGVGCLIWQWIGEGQSRSRILSMLNARFAAGPEEIATAVDSFLADLVTHKLVREIDWTPRHVRTQCGGLFLFLPFLAQIPLARYGEVADIAAAATFLASDAAGYITGHTLDVNGGMYMG